MAREAFLVCNSRGGRNVKKCLSSSHQPNAEPLNTPREDVHVPQHQKSSNEACSQHTKSEWLSYTRGSGVVCTTKKSFFFGSTQRPLAAETTPRNNLSLQPLDVRLFALTGIIIRKGTIALTSKGLHLKQREVFPPECANQNVQNVQIKLVTMGRGSSCQDIQPPDGQAEVGKKISIIA